MSSTERRLLEDWLESLRPVDGAPELSAPNGSAFKNRRLASRQLRALKVDSLDGPLMLQDSPEIMRVLWTLRAIVAADLLRLSAAEISRLKLRPKLEPYRPGIPADIKKGVREF